ncbi:hypothetical protein E4U28_004190 [Claviceps purpurea]|nr:hypothetical protein E4U28_004190 [Claviceps purpurea]
MDASTPIPLVDDISDLKTTNSRLEIFVSIGGWTFSDNDTYTQPVFGNIARSSENRVVVRKGPATDADKYLQYSKDEFVVFRSDMSSKSGIGVEAWTMVMILKVERRRVQIRKGITQVRLCDRAATDEIKKLVCQFYETCVFGTAVTQYVVDRMVM